MLPKPFKEFIALLEENGVKFVVVGGYALAVHGYPRYTGDIDIFIAVSPESAAGTLKTFRGFGFTDLNVHEADFLTEDMIVEIGREPLKIQVMTGISGVTFDQCYQSRIMVEDHGQIIPFISYEMLLENKSATTRAKDKADVEELLKRNQKKADR